MSGGVLLRVRLVWTTYYILSCLGVFGQGPGVLSSGDKVGRDPSVPRGAFG